MTLFNSISNALLFVLEIIKRFVSWVLGTSGNAGTWLQYGIALGIAISILFFAIKSIRSSIWGS